MSARSAIRGPVVLLACDLPFVEPALLRLLVEWPGDRHRDPGGRGPAASTRARATARAALERARVALRSGELSLRGIADSGFETLTEAEWGAVADERAFADVDTPGGPRAARSGLRCVSRSIGACSHEICVGSSSGHDRRTC